MLFIITITGNEAQAKLVSSAAMQISESGTMAMRSRRVSEKSQYRLAIRKRNKLIRQNAKQSEKNLALLKLSRSRPDWSSTLMTKNNKIASISGRKITFSSAIGKSENRTIE